MPDANHDPRSWGRPGSWTVESRRDALDRTPGFGQRFFALVFGKFPTLAVATKFLRCSDQPDDVYAVFDLPGGGIGVQIDPDLESIIIWSRDGQAEYGDWGCDQVPPAVEHIRQLVHGYHVSPSTLISSEERHEPR